ncbi:hypothetical protein LINPERHAP1_LOCUS34925 [Linum perenne]
MTTPEGQWDFQRLERLLAPEAVDVVGGMSPPQPDKGDDDWVWGLEKSGSTDSAGMIAVKSVNWEVKVREAMKFETGTLTASGKKRQIHVAWTAGPPGWVTVNSDGSVLAVGGKAVV